MKTKLNDVILQKLHKMLDIHDDEGFVGAIDYLIGERKAERISEWECKVVLEAFMQQA